MKEIKLLRNMIFPIFFNKSWNKNLLTFSLFHFFLLKTMSIPRKFEGKCEKNKIGRKSKRKGKMKKNKN